MVLRGGGKRKKGTEERDSPGDVGEAKKIGQRGADGV
jgi:hypothetical protein